MKIAPQVLQAIKNHQPVVVLESTIIAFGMPYPENVKTALEVEEEIKRLNVVPATIGIIDGEAIIGMNKEEIEQFGQRNDVWKVSRRDLPIVYAGKKWGATTVASTMILAAQAGIEVFVTGGIGGVHRNYQATLDISSDLEELAKTNVTVVSSGAKSILDLPATLEYLETKGVPVIGYKTKEFPAFYTRKSGLPVTYSTDNLQEIAKIIVSKRNEQLEGGVLVANPIPEGDSFDKDEIEKVIQEALIEANKKDIHGKDTTPFLLAKVAELTKGNSLKSNIALIKNNAQVGAKLAIEIAKLTKK